MSITEPAVLLNQQPRLVGVYAHLPFCDVKCAYCDFYSIAQRHVDAAFWARYAQRLERDLARQYELLSEDLPQPRLTSVFFGGGTPSKAPGFLFQKIITAVRAKFRLAGVEPEISAEANPESLTEQVLADWHAAGINRVSVGMQSLDEQVLKYLGRLYDPRAYKNVLPMIRRSGITNYSADFITGVPGQTTQSTLTDLKFALANGVSHVSLYQLTLEPGTLLKGRVESGKRLRPAEQQQVEQMDAAIDFLERQGFNRYEVSNFSVTGKQARHNLIYWTGRPYLGLGVAAHAFTGRRRFFHPRSLDKFMGEDYFLAEDPAVTTQDVLINWLRLRRKMNPAKILALYPAGKRAAVQAKLALGLEKGWLEESGRALALTHLGLKHTDSLLADLWNI